MNIPIPARRARSRKLMALALVTGLFLALDELTLAAFGAALEHFPGMQRLAAAPAARGDARTLPPVLPAADVPAARSLFAAFKLGQKMGMAAEMAGLSLVDAPPAQKRQHDEARHIVEADRLDTVLGIAPVTLWAPRTLGELNRLDQLVEQDASGVGARIEAATSARHRQLYIAGMHLGVHTYMALLADAFPPWPGISGAAFARHATLAGVPRGLWQPLMETPAGADRRARQAAYVRHITALEDALRAGEPGVAAR